MEAVFWKVRRQDKPCDDNLEGMLVCTTAIIGVKDTGSVAQAAEDALCRETMDTRVCAYFVSNQQLLSDDSCSEYDINRARTQQRILPVVS